MYVELHCFSFGTFGTRKISADEFIMAIVSRNFYSQFVSINKDKMVLY